jgi:hypothetical protein
MKTKICSDLQVIVGFKSFDHEVFAAIAVTFAGNQQRKMNVLPIQ